MMLKSIRNTIRSVFLRIWTRRAFKRLFKLSSEIFMLNRTIQRSELPGVVKEQSAALLDAYVKLNKSIQYERLEVK